MHHILPEDLIKIFKCSPDEALEMVRLMGLPYEDGEDDWERMEKIGDVIGLSTYSPHPVPAVFLDVGDTYAPTLVCQDGDFEIGDWGTYLENYEDENEAWDYEKQEWDEGEEDEDEDDPLYRKIADGDDFDEED